MPRPPLLGFFFMNAPLTPIMKINVTVALSMINESFHERTNPMMMAVIKPDTPLMKRPIFCPIPSWTRFMSELIRVVTSPDPRKSKKAMFCLKMARR
jgi:hypothetical protein